MPCALVLKHSVLKFLTLFYEYMPWCRDIVFRMILTLFYEYMSLIIQQMAPSICHVNIGVLKTWLGISDRINFSHFISLVLIKSNVLDKDDCEEEPCSFGHCIDMVDKYHCDCNIFFTGLNCTKSKLLNFNNHLGRILEDN